MIVQHNCCGSCHERRAAILHGNSFDLQGIPMHVSLRIKDEFWKNVVIVESETLASRKIFVQNWAVNVDKNLFQQYLRYSYVIELKQIAILCLMCERGSGVCHFWDNLIRLPVIVFVRSWSISVLYAAFSMISVRRPDNAFFILTKLCLVLNNAAPE
jgi:hypothetical protein